MSARCRNSDSPGVPFVPLYVTPADDVFNADWNRMNETDRTWATFSNDAQCEAFWCRHTRSRIAMLKFNRFRFYKGWEAMPVPESGLPAWERPTPTQCSSVSRSPCGSNPYTSGLHLISAIQPSNSLEPIPETADAYDEWPFRTCDMEELGELGSTTPPAHSPTSRDMPSQHNELSTPVNPLGSSDDQTNTGDFLEQKMHVILPRGTSDVDPTYQPELNPPTVTPATVQLAQFKQCGRHAAKEGDTPKIPLRFETQPIVVSAYAEEQYRKRYRILMAKKGRKCTLQFPPPFNVDDVLALLVEELDEVEMSEIVNQTTIHSERFNLMRNESLERLRGSTKEKQTSTSKRNHSHVSDLTNNNVEPKRLFMGVAKENPSSSV